MEIPSRILGELGRFPNDADQFPSFHLEDKVKVWAGVNDRPPIQDLRYVSYMRGGRASLGKKIKI